MNTSIEKLIDEIRSKSIAAGVSPGPELKKIATLYAATAAAVDLGSLLISLGVPVTTVGKIVRDTLSATGPDASRSSREFLAEIEITAPDHFDELLKAMSAKMKACVKELTDAAAAYERENN